MYMVPLYSTVFLFSSRVEFGTIHIVNMRMTTVGATYTTHAPWVRWGYRLLGVFFVYTSLSIPAGPTLLDTPLVTTLQAEYPTWYHVLWDIFLTLLILGIVANILKLFVGLAKEHRVSKHVINRLKKIDTRFFRALVSFEFFASRWLIGTLVAIGIWHVVAPLLAAVFSWHVPAYAEQPVIMVIGIFGILLIIESIGWWQQKMQKYFCMHVHL